jgi:hypothetical protein
MLIGRIGAQGARGFAVEFCGSAIEALSIEARFTLCNMAVEAGARGALVAPDAKAIEYVLRRAPDIAGQTCATRRSRTGHAAQRRRRRLRREHHFDASEVAPHVTWGTSPDQVVPSTGACPRRRRHRCGCAARAPNRRCTTPARGWQAVAGSAGAARVHRLLHQRPHRRPARSRVVVRDRVSHPACARWSCPDPARCATRPSPKGSRSLLPGRGIRVAPAGLLDVPGDERRRAGRACAAPRPPTATSKAARAAARSPTS